MHDRKLSATPGQTAPSAHNFMTSAKPNFLEGVPAGPQGLDLTQLAALYNQVPFVTAPFISKTRNTRNGRGMLGPVSGKQNTVITVTHNLGRLAQGMVMISNGLNNELYKTHLRMVQGGQRTPAVQDIESDGPLTSAIVWFI